MFEFWSHRAWSQISLPPLPSCVTWAVCFNLSVFQCPVKVKCNVKIAILILMRYFAPFILHYVFRARCDFSWSEHIFIWTRPCRCSTDPPSPGPSPSSLDLCGSIPFHHSYSLAVANTHSSLLAPSAFGGICLAEEGFPGGSVVKNPPANAGDVGSIPGLGRSPGEGTASHSSILAWRIPWTEEPSGLQSMGWQSQT